MSESIKGIQNRLASLVKAEGLSFSAFEELCGLSNGSAKKISPRSREDTWIRIKTTFPEWDMEWLRCGINTKAEIPVVPADVSRQPNLDVWEYMQINTVHAQPVIKQFSEYNLYHRMQSDAMSPRLMPGDILALRRTDIKSIIINGEVYCIDIRESGFTIREVTATDGGFLMHALNPRYADFLVPVEQVLGIYKVIGAVITHI